jgi:hypothetical protein
MMTATMDVRRVADVMDVVAMSALRMHRMFHWQADGFDGSRGRSSF